MSESGQLGICRSGARLWPLPDRSKSRPSTLSVINQQAHPDAALQQRRITMRDLIDFIPPVARREPWNKGYLIGAKPPLRAKHVWSIRAKLQMVGRIRDLAMFNLAIDSKLRGCDVVNLKVEDVAPHGHAVDRAT